MVVDTIYVARHGHRMNWTVDPATGTYATTAPTPTGIPADPQLASYGVSQATQLADKVATLEPEPDVIYSSPFYRCLQTIEPSHRKLRAGGRYQGSVRVENGISEFFGKAWFEHPAPAALRELGEHFDFLDPSHKPSIVPAAHGESLEQIHARLAYALERMVEALDADPRQPRAALLYVGEEDFRCGTCALSTFRRRSTRKPKSDSGTTTDLWSAQEPQKIPAVAWRDGQGVGGGWDCVANGDCSFLQGGEERSWHFTGDESFMLDQDEDAPESAPTPRREDGAKL